MVYSAGVLPYAIVHGNVYLLLGMDRRDGSWSDFGGRSENGDMQDPRKTAAREFYEESSGCVMTHPSICASISHIKPWKSLTIGKNDYYMFPMRIPYNDVIPEHFHLFASLASYAKIHKKFSEKTKVAWFSAERVMNTLLRETDLKLRFVFADTLQRNLEQFKQFSQVIVHGNKGVRSGRLQGEPPEEPSH
jgi:predicted NUDIX family NTP pyrophosphohydrolase